MLGEPTATHTKRRKIRSALSPWELPARPARTVKLFVQQMNLSLMYCCWLQEGLRLGQTSPVSVIAMLKSSFLSNVLPRMVSG